LFGIDAQRYPAAFVHGNINPSTPGSTLRADLIRLSDLRHPGRYGRSSNASKRAAGSRVAVVATARKLTVPSWHLVTNDEDYAFAVPA
jgi:hypothetical protein